MDLQSGFCTEGPAGAGQRAHQRLEEAGPSAVSNRSQEQQTGGAGRGRAAQMAGGNEDLQRKHLLNQTHCFKKARHYLRVLRSGSPQSWVNLYSGEHKQQIYFLCSHLLLKQK